MANCELSKQAYSKCEDLENQFNYLKQKISNPQPSNQSQEQSVFEFKGVFGTGKATKRFVKLNVPIDTLVRYIMQLNILDSSQDEQFEAFIYFDEQLVSHKLFFVSNGQGKVNLEFEHTSTKEQIDLKIVICAHTNTTTFNFDSCITYANKNNLTYDIPNKIDNDNTEQYSLALSFMGEPNALSLPQSYVLAFKKGQTLYSGCIDRKNFDLDRIEYKTLPVETTFSSFVYSNYNGAYHQFSRPVIISYYNGNSPYFHDISKYEASNYVFGYPKKMDCAPAASSINTAYTHKWLLLNDTAFSYCMGPTFMAYYSQKLTYLPIENISKVYMLKPRTVQEAASNEVIALIDKYDTFFISYNYTRYNEGIFFTVNDAKEAFIVNGVDYRNIIVYIRHSDKLVAYDLYYNTSTYELDLQSTTEYHNIDMLYPGFDNEAFYIKNGRVFYTKNKDLLLW